MGIRKIATAFLLLSTWLVPAAAWAGTTPLRVISYNIYLGKSLVKEREADSEKERAAKSMADAINREGRLRGADILGAQELCAHQGGWQLAYFEKLLGGPDGQPVYTTFGLADPVGPGHGNCQRGEAIFSRYPIVQSGLIQLPNVKEERSAVWADVDVGGTLVRVYNAHLENAPKGSGPKGRLKQTQAIVEHLTAWRRFFPEAPVILLGDLNTVGYIIDPFVRESSLKLLARHMLPSHPKFARTHRLLIHQIDWIFADRLELQGSHVVKLKFSDHYPIVADYLLRD